MIDLGVKPGRSEHARKAKYIVALRGVEGGIGTLPKLPPVPFLVFQLVVAVFKTHYRVINADVFDRKRDRRDDIEKIKEV